MGDVQQRGQQSEAGFPAESTAMRLFRRLGLESTAWSLRRLHCPVDSEALVLEVGSGGNPYARANVLLDSYEESRERHWAPLKVDRPFVLAFGESLPFKDRVFDFVIASHVLEHSSSPDRFLDELQRVAKAGYIEVPDAFFERINPYRDHRAEVTARNGRLVICKKKAWIVDPEVVGLYEDRVKRILTRRLIPKHPFAFHTRFYWRDRIDYIIVNPQTDSAWAPPVDPRQSPAVPRLSPIQRLKAVAGDTLRLMFSQGARNRRIDLLALLTCPACGNESLSKTAERVMCDKCKAHYPIKNGIWVMHSREEAGDVRSSPNH